jgi:hypothetical protein
VSRSQVRSLLIGCVIAGSFLLTSSHAFADGPGWSITPTPESSMANAFLNSVSCTSPTFCMAVGVVGAPQKSLDEQWDGTEWSIVPTPAGGASLSAVSCTSPSFCMAVGVTTSNASISEEWDGASWSVLPTAPSEAEGISCTSPAFCMAVGTAYGFNAQTSTSTAASWDGTGWSDVATPDPSTSVNVLFGVSCLGPSSCVAVGEYYSPSGAANDSLMLSWNGTAWSMTPSPNAANSTLNFPQSVSCTSQDSCVAIGHAKIRDSDGSITIESQSYAWDGSTWSMLLTSNLGPLSGVACIAASSCVSVGASDTGTLLEYWNGSTWSPESSPPLPGTPDDLVSVACPIATFCVAVGGAQTDGVYGALAEMGGIPSPQVVTTTTMGSTTTSANYPTTTQVASGTSQPVTSPAQASDPVSAASASLAFTGPGRATEVVALIGGALVLLGLTGLLVPTLRRRVRPLHAFAESEAGPRDGGSAHGATAQRACRAVATWLLGR